MNVAFHSNQISLLGTEIALFDYAHFNETLLGNKSFVFSNRYAHNHDLAAIQKFAGRFPVSFYEHPNSISQLCEQNKIDVLYCIKAGLNDGITSRSCKTVIHVVFEYFEPHGDVYAYVSKWLSDKLTQGKTSYVPHMVNLPKINDNLRAALSIPEQATVFGQYGARDAFNIPWVHKSVVEALSARSDLYFIFMNTAPFCDPHPRLLHLEGSSDLFQKSRFINSCDAMLHARDCGETFGLAVAEFSSMNKPVFTWSGSWLRSHIETLGTKGVYYKDQAELLGAILAFDRTRPGDWDAFSVEFNPAAVMAKFSVVFLNTP